MSGSQKLDLPDTSRLELFLAGVRAAAAAIPLVGGSIAEAVGYFGQREVDKRLNRFLEEVIQCLEDTHADVATLKDSFWTIFLHAAEVARRTHQQEKYEALRNAVLNAARPMAPSEDLQYLFVRYVDELTRWHLVFLSCITDPLGWAQQRNYPVLVVKDVDARVIFEGATREELPSPELNKVLLQDLYSRGLAEDEANPYSMLSPSPESLHPHITNLQQTAER